MTANKIIAGIFVSAALLACGAAGISVSAAGNGAPGLLKDCRAVQIYSNTAYYSGEKTEMFAPAIVKNNSVLLSEADFETLFDVDVSESGNSIMVDGVVQMTVGSYNFTYGGENYSLAAAPEITDGILYLPPDEYGEQIYGLGYNNDGHGMLCAGTGEGSYNEIKESNLYLFFERKTPAELKAEFLSSNDGGAKHPRLIADSEDFLCIAEEVKSDPVKAEWYSKVIYTANSILNQPLVEYKISDGRLLDTANAALLRMQYLGFAYQITKDTKYSSRGIKELEAICAFPDWHPEHYLDTGTLASAAAIGYDWLYEAMTETQRRDIAQKAQEYALDSAEMAYDGNASFNSFWVSTETNWGIVCNGGIANLALATGEYNTDSAMAVLSKALRAIEYPWYRFAPDGAWYEGTDYWSYLLTHLSLFMSSYESAMGEAFGKNFMGLDKFAQFQIQFTGPDGLANNFHDADEAVIQSEGQFYLAELYGDISLMKYRIGFMEEYNIKPAVMDIIWCHAGLSGDMTYTNLSIDDYFRETEFVSMRGGWNNDDSWISFHGGDSDNAHDHIDPGTFVFCIGGVRWAVDIGKEPLSYLDDSQNPAVQAGYNSYYFYRRKGEGHNIVVINPDDKLEINQSAYAKAAKPVSTPDGSYSYIDLSEAYKDDVYSYKRGYKLTDSRRTFTIRDEIELKKTSELHWYMHTKGDIEIIDNNTAIISQDGKKLLMRFTTNQQDYSLHSAEAKSSITALQFENSENTGITKLDYSVFGSGIVSITVKMSLIGDAGSNGGVDTTDIEDWSSDSKETIYKLANQDKLEEYGYKLEEIPASGGRPENETAYMASVSGVPASVTDEPGFEIPFYANHINTDKSIRTMELSLRYAESNGCTKISSYIAAHPSNWQWYTVVEFVRFEDGKVYVNGVDTGLTAKDGEWFHIVVEEHYNAADTRVLINGKEFDPGLSNYIFGNRWTQVSAGRTSLNTDYKYDASIVIKDVVCYEGSYIANNNDIVSFRTYNNNLAFNKEERKLVITGNIDADELCEDIITDGTAKVISSVSNGYSVNGSVLNGDVLVITSEDKKSCEYYYITAQAERLKLYINGLETGSVSEGVLKAETVFEGNGKGALIMAIYKDGVLQSVSADEKTIDGRTVFSIEKTLEDAEGVTVKLMLWNENMRPYIRSEEFK